MNRVEQSLLVAAYYRGGRPEDARWTSNSDQVVALSLFYTEDISAEDCAERFSRRRYVGGLYQKDGRLDNMVGKRYAVLRGLLEEHPELIVGGGDFQKPADPTFTACRLTNAGRELACSLVSSFPRKPEFPNWPDA